jgi:sulfur-oxidizing protein SoxY
MADDVEVSHAQPRLDVSLNRRRWLLLAATATTASHAQEPVARADAYRREEDVKLTVGRLIGDTQPQTGRIHIGLPQIADSGNSVPLTVRVDSPMTATDHVRVIHVVAERNPRPWVASFMLGPKSGRAEVQTYIRLSDTQAVAVYARMSDGAWWMQRAEVVVTIGACESLSVRY